MSAAVVEDLRAACAEVARRARSVRVEQAAVAAYAHALAPHVDAQRAAPPDPEAELTGGSQEELAAFWLTLDAINFGSGWFPTLRKRPGRSGYFTIAIGIRERFATAGPWSAGELCELAPGELSAVVDQDRDHPLIALFARSLNDLGAHVAREHAGRFAAVADAADGSAVVLAQRLGGWASFADTSLYDGLEVPFLKRAQIAAADLAAAGVAELHDLERLTMFADNLVPHVLRLDGVLHYDPALVARIEAGDVLAHGSPEEVEIRACGLHAVELIAAELGGRTAAEIDRTLWNRGQLPHYKAVPRHRSRCTAY